MRGRVGLAMAAAGARDSPDPAPPCTLVPLLPLLAYATAGDAANGFLNGWDIATLQRWTLIYLGLSSLAFVVVWLVGYLRRPG